MSDTKTKPENYYTNIRLDILEDIKDEKYKSILEIGGGNFQLLNVLGKKYDANCTGVDIVDLPSSDTIDVVVGSIESEETQKQLRQKEYDLIIANDVIEHLVDPKETLHFLRKLSSEGASLHISVPNIRQIRAFFHIFVRGTFPAEESGLFDKTHLHWFCKRDIVSLLEKAGFRVESVYFKGRLVPKFIRSSLVAEFLGLQTVIRAVAR